MTLEEQMFMAVSKRNHAYFKNLPQDVNLNAQNEQGNTLLHQLVLTEFVPFGIENVLKRHPNPFIENQDGMTPRMLAVWHNHMPQANFLAAYEESYKTHEQQRQFKQQVEALAIVSSLFEAIAPKHARSETYPLIHRLDRLVLQMQYGVNSHNKE